jgi:hypothetical protein
LYATEKEEASEPVTCRPVVEQQPVYQKAGALGAAVVVVVVVVVVGATVVVVVVGALQIVQLVVEIANV